MALLAGLSVLLGLGLALGGREPRIAFLLVIGALCGITLYHAAFGFAAAYRRLLLNRDGRGVRAQLVMLGVATCMFAPVLAAGWSAVRLARRSCHPALCAGRSLCPHPGMGTIGRVNVAAICGRCFSTAPRPMAADGRGGDPGAAQL
ncbi:MAG: YeeE/YedE family protein [Betaproteobacteria bacterium]|nr:YeeE/YedE family protein [Betaproteobacteria bacterium]MBI2960723.1 YeeE/YedE family protein [Betaproteobacteria bacterium]